MREKINKFVFTKAVLSTFLLSALFMSAVTILGISIIDITPPIRLTVFTIWQLILSSIIILLMRKLDVFDINDFRFKGVGKGLLIAWFGIVYAIITFFIVFMQIPENSFIAPNIFYLLIVIIHPFIGTGFFEEVLFRGLVLKILLKKFGSTKKRIVGAILISSVFFGSVHFVNIIAGAPVLPTITQIIHASTGGFFYAIVYLRTRKLLIPILFHGLLNVAAQIFDAIISPEVLMQNANALVETDIIGFIVNTLFISLPVLIAGLFLLRKVKPEEISAEIQAETNINELTGGSDQQ